MSISEGKVPVLGLGTFEPGTNGNGRCAIAVREGIRAGYRHIDTAALYGCEEEVGEGIRASGVPREELFIATKLSATQCHDGLQTLISNELVGSSITSPRMSGEVWTKV